MRVSRADITKWVAIAAAVVAVVVIVLVLFTGGSGYTVNAQFTDAGQLVSGDKVVVAGRQVGSVQGMSITNNGLADVKMSISDKTINPLKSTSTATIGQLSLTGVTNRFVSISPGVDGTNVPDNGTLPVSQTKGIVDLDTVLDTLTPQVRQSLIKFLHTGAYFVNGKTPKDFSTFVQYLNPAMSQLSNLGAEVVSDKYALDRLLGSGAKLTSSLASNTPAFESAVSNTSNVLSQLSNARGALADSFNRAPSVFAQGDQVLGHVDTTLRNIQPTLTALQPVAPKLASFLRAVGPFASNLRPTVGDLQALLPEANSALTKFPAVGAKATPAMKSLASMLRQIEPITTGVRPYTPDLVEAFFNGVVGNTGASYDANGHYLHARLSLPPSTPTLKNVVSLLGPAAKDVQTSGVINYGQVRPCPGGGAGSSPDGSAPWTNPGGVAKSLGTLCSPSDDQGAG
ncbi:MAG: MCE family protein [Solirubrobacterales bacterium]|nr:MCE family protein [Solirubrobacterales bacterium]